MLLCYDWGIYPPEANVLENIWRQSIRCCIAQKKRKIVTILNASSRTYLPEELWDYILNIHDTSPDMITDLRLVGYSVHGKLYTGDVSGGVRGSRTAHPTFNYPGKK